MGHDIPGRLVAAVAAAVTAVMLASSSGAAGAAEAPKPSPMKREAAVKFLEGVVDARAELKTIATSFKHTAVSFLLAEPSVSKGYLRIRKPDWVRRDILEPSRSALVLRGTVCAFCQPRQKPRKFDLKDTKGSDVAGTILRLLTAEKFELTEIEKRFDVKTFSVGRDLMLEMKPKEQALADKLPVLRITFAPKGIWPKRVEWESLDGDSFTDEFGEPKINSELPDPVFSDKVNWKEKLPPAEAGAAPKKD